MEQSPTTLSFKQDQKSLTALNTWYAWIHELDSPHKGGRADRARLRRANSPDDLMLSDAFFRFLRFPGMPDAVLHEQNWLAMAIIAGALAHTNPGREGKRHNDKSFAAQLATPLEPGGKAPMSELRFSQLQKSRNHEEFYRRLVRAVQLIKGNVNVMSLADSVQRWCHEQRFGVDRTPMKRLAVNWAKEYFSALPRD